MKVAGKHYFAIANVLRSGISPQLCNQIGNVLLILNDGIGSVNHANEITEIPVLEPLGCLLRSGKGKRCDYSEDYQRKNSYLQSDSKNSIYQSNYE